MFFFWGTKEATGRVVGVQTPMRDVPVKESVRRSFWLALPADYRSHINRRRVEEALEPHPAEWAPPPMDERQKRVQEAVNAYLGERTHSSECDGPCCIPPEEKS